MINNLSHSVRGYLKGLNSILGHKQTNKDKLKSEAKEESIRDNLDLIPEQIAEPDKSKDQINNDAMINKPSFTTDKSEDDSLAGNHQIYKPANVELDIDPSKTLSLKTRNSAKKVEDIEQNMKPKKLNKDKKTKKGTVKVDDLVINKDLINSNRF